MDKISRIVVSIVNNASRNYTYACIYAKSLFKQSPKMNKIFQKLFDKIQ